MASTKNSPLFLEVGQGISVMTGLTTIAAWDDQGRPKKPKNGTFGFNSETSNLEYWDGTTWLKAQMS